MEKKKLRIFDSMYTMQELLLDFIIITLSVMGMLLFHKLQGDAITWAIIISICKCMLFMYLPYRLARVVPFYFFFKVIILVEYVYFNIKIYGHYPNVQFFYFLLTGSLIVLRIIQTIRMSRRTA